MNAQREALPLTREQVDITRTWLSLPADEREEFRIAIVARALQREEAIEVRPAVVVRLVR